MRLGLVISVLLHLGLLAWATISIQTPREFRVPRHEPMAVSLITADELTRLKKGVRTAKQLKAIAPKKTEKTKTVKPPKKIVPKAVEAVKPPPPPAPPKEDPIARVLEKLPKAPPKPSPDELKKKEEAKKQAEAEKKLLEKKLAEAKAKRLAEEARRKAEEKKKREEERKKAEAKKRAEERKKAEAKKRKARERKKRLAAKRRKERLRRERARKKRLAALARRKKRKSFDPDRLSALLNKLPEDRAPPPDADEPLPRKRRRARPGLGAPEGRDDRLTASEEAVLKSMISRQLAGCWSLPGGGGGTEVATVTLSWRLTRSGHLDGEPRVVRGRNDVIGRIAQEAAIRAVKTCEPFRLPPDKYHAWKLIEWEFDPREML